MADNTKSEEQSKLEEDDKVKNREDDLDSLLDSALDDFTTLEKPKPAANKAETSTDVKTEASGSEEAQEEEAEHMWSDMIKQALDIDPSIRGMFQQGSSDESKFVQDFSRIAEAAAKVIEGESPPSNFTDIMSETLRNLNEASESVQNQFGNPDELANMFQELGVNGPGPLAGANTAMNDLPPFMQSIMQSFLSKEILYPAVKEFVDRYPPWLEEHKETLPADQYDNYCKQLEIMKKLVAEFEAESESDSEDVKRQRFQNIMENMQQMQSFGQPPADLICGDGDNPFDESAMPPLPPGMDPNQCSVM